ncbi:hypothetical protein L209DRAFT_489661 [Thermothelomyces heterothallicus CBS 203.75]
MVSPGCVGPCGFVGQSIPGQRVAGQSASVPLEISKFATELSGTTRPDKSTPRVLSTVDRQCILYSSLKTTLGASS